MIPTSILVGLGAATLWSAQGTYLTIVGNMQARKTGQVGKDVVNQYFGIFFLIFQSSGVWGNLISSLVFGQTPTQGKRKWGPPRAPGPSPHVLIRDMDSCHMGPKTCFSDCPLPSSSLDSLGGSEGLSGPRVPWPPLLREGALGTEDHYLWNANSWSPSVQFSGSVVSDSLQPMDRSTPGLTVHHQLPEFTQTHVH